MKQSSSEGEFQRGVVNLLRGVGAHVQIHSERAMRAIPDMSVGYAGRDWWLELKYSEFNIEREYDRFYFKYCERDQLEWLKLRTEAGKATCGILGYFRTKPNHLTHYVFFMTAHDYLRVIWKKDISAAAVILSDSAIDADRINNGHDLMTFINEAQPGGLAQRG